MISSGRVIDGRYYPAAHLRRLDVCPPYELWHRGGVTLIREETATLAAVRVKVAGLQPSLQLVPDQRPLIIRDRVPSRVAASTLIDAGLAEDALE